jgi:hypothetical protein
MTVSVCEMKMRNSALSRGGAAPQSLAAAAQGEKLSEPFPLKLLTMLQQTKANPDLVRSVGAFWCADGRHFVTHTVLVAKYLQCTYNSVGHNFREYGFPKAEDDSSWDRSEYGDLPQPRAWHKRYQESGTFCVNTTPPKRAKSRAPSLALLHLLFRFHRPGFLSRQTAQRSFGHFSRPAPQARPRLCCSWTGRTATQDGSERSCKL